MLNADLPAPLLASCEKVSASSTSPHHARLLTYAGILTSGGADSPSLCNETMSWDVGEVSLLEVVAPHPGRVRYCTNCTTVAQALLTIGVDGFDRTELRQVLRAYQLAARAHLGQTDKTGNPYLDHPVRVASYVDGADEKAVALLHDVVEDSDVTAQYIAQSFPTAVSAAVVALTHQPSEPRTVYLDRVLDAGWLAIQVKKADIRDNTDPARVAALDTTTRERLATKYETAAKQLGTTVAGIHAEFPAS